MTLSKREQRMLYFLGCFMVVAIGLYLFILPAIGTHAALSKQLEDLEAQQLVRVQSIARMGALDNRVNTLRSEITDGANRYAPILDSEVLDGVYTSMLRRYNAHPTALVIGELTNDTALAHYGDKADFDGAELTIEEVPPLNEYMAAINPNAHIDTATPVETPPPARVSGDAPTTRAQAIGIEAIMKPADARAFLAELSADPAILVQSVNLSQVILVGGTAEAPVTSTTAMLSVEFLNLLVPDLPSLVTNSSGAAFS